MPHLDIPFQSIDHPFVDKLLDGPPRIALRIGPATNDDGDTFVAAVGFGVGADLEALYGNALMQAVFIAAVGLDSGAHHWRAVAHPHAPSAAGARPDLPPPPPEDGGDEENTAAELVSLDLVRHLDLPRDGTRYGVFAWLDDLVSDVAVLKMPDDDAPSAAPAVSDLLPPGTAPDAASSDAPRFDAASRTLILPAGAADGPVAVFAVDGATRQVTASSWRRFPDGARGIGLTDYIQTRTPSHHATRILCLAGPAAVHSVIVPTPDPMGGPLKDP